MDRVREVYIIDEDLLHSKTHESKYWKTCYNFWEEVKNKKIPELTEKQLEWLDKISEDLEND